MVNVISKRTGRRFEVYNITYDKSGFPHFLIYKDGQWLTRSAKHFKPVELYKSNF